MPSPHVAQQFQRVGIVREQPVQPIGRSRHRDGIEPPPALIALQDFRPARIEAEASGIRDAFRECRGVPQTEIKPLPRQRMHHMRGVAE